MLAPNFNFNDARTLRRSRIRLLIDRVTARGAMTVTVANNRLRTASLGASRPAHHGVYTPYGAMPSQRDCLAEFARVFVWPNTKAVPGIRPQHTQDASEFINENFGQGPLRRKCVLAWNRALAPYSNRELAFGDCGHAHPWQTSTTVAGGSRICEECLEQDYVTCYDTDEYHERDAVYRHSNGEYYTYEEDESNDDDDDEGSDDDGLAQWGGSTEFLNHDKSFTPSPTGDFTMGIELEVEVERYASDSRSEVVRNTDNHFNCSNLGRYAMFKKDGSLSERRGFEIVTAARRMGDHIKMFSNWKPEDLEAWDADHCGTHVHIDSRAFTALSLGKFLMMYNDPNNEGFITGIAGRHPNTDIAAGDYARALSNTANPRTVKSAADNSSRYRMVNVMNLTKSERDRLKIPLLDRNSKGDYSTVEVRIFRATLRKARLLAQIEFAHASVAFCRVASWSDLSGEAFKAWLAGTAGYPHLTRWFGTSKAFNSRYAKRESARADSAEV